MSEAEAGPSGFDLDSFDTVTKSVSGVPYAIRDPRTGEPITDKAGNQMIFRLLGPESDQYKAHMMKQGSMALKAAMAAQRGPGAADSAVDAKAMLDAEINQLVACTLGWENITRHKQPFPFSRDNAEIVYREYPLIRAQVANFINNRMNFLGE